MWGIWSGVKTWKKGSDVHATLRGTFEICYGIPNIMIPFELLSQQLQLYHKIITMDSFLKTFFFPCNCISILQFAIKKFPKSTPNIHSIDYGHN